MYPERIDPPEPTLIPPMPRELAHELREDAPKLYHELMLDELYERAQKIFDLHVERDGIGILHQIDDCEWAVGDSDFAIDWWREQQ